MDLHVLVSKCSRDRIIELQNMETSINLDISFRLKIVKCRYFLCNTMHLHVQDKIRSISFNHALNLCQYIGSACMYKGHLQK